MDFLNETNKKESENAIDNLKKELNRNTLNIEEKITKNITNEIERAMAMSSASANIPEIYKSYESHCPIPFLSQPCPPPRPPNYTTGTKPRTAATHPSVTYASQLNKQRSPNPVRQQQTENAKPNYLGPSNLETSPSENNKSEKRSFMQEDILIGDSNIKFISAKRFPIPIAKVRCPTLQKLPETLQNMDIPNAKKSSSTWEPTTLKHCNLLNSRTSSSLLLKW